MFAYEAAYVRYFLAEAIRGLIHEQSAVSLRDLETRIRQVDWLC